MFCARAWAWASRPRLTASARKAAKIDNNNNCKTLQNKSSILAPLDGHNLVFRPSKAAWRLCTGRVGALGADVGPFLDGVDPKSSKLGGPKRGSRRMYYKRHFGTDV